MGRKTGVYTTGEAARVLACSQQTVIRVCDSGALAHYKVPGSRFRRIPRAALLRFALASDVPLDGFGELSPEELATVALARGETSTAEVFAARLTTADRFAADRLPAAG